MADTAGLCRGDELAGMAFTGLHAGLDSLHVGFTTRSRSKRFIYDADVTPNLGGVFGGHIDVIDLLALIFSTDHCRFWRTHCACGWHGIRRRKHD